MGNQSRDISEIRRMPHVTESLRPAAGASGAEAETAAAHLARAVAAIHPEVTRKDSSGRAMEVHRGDRSPSGDEARKSPSLEERSVRGKEISLRVMVVEDDPDQQWRLARCLTVRGHRVVGTSSFEGAIALSQGWKVDLVLIAEEVGGGAGLDVVRRLRRSLSGVGLILMTSRSDMAFQREAAGEGILAILRKPVNPIALADTLAALAQLRRRQGVRAVLRDAKGKKQMRTDRLRAASVALG